MSTEFRGEGNIGSAPEYREFPSDEGDPDRLLRLSIYFDNPVPTHDGQFEDKGGFWMAVEIRHTEAHHWSKLYQKGMRVLVLGRLVRGEWTDDAGNLSVVIKIRARRVAILPYRLERVVLDPKPAPATDTGEREAVDS
jgi:single-strand DNA-binding protein